MTIDELNALTTLTAADEVPVWDSEESGEPTKKITASNLAASVKSLASLPNTTEMETAIAQSTAKGDTAFDAITRSDATDITTFADTVEAGKIQFFRNRASEPTSAWNYSPGIVLRPTSSETVVVLFGLRVNSIAMLRKDGGTWASDWTIIS